MKNCHTFSQLPQVIAASLFFAAAPSGGAFQLAAGYTFSGAEVSGFETLREDRIGAGDYLLNGPAHVEKFRGVTYAGVDPVSLGNPSGYFTYGKATAGLGFLKARTSIRKTDWTWTGSIARAAASAYIIDTLTIDGGPARNGTPGSLSVQLRIDGNLSTRNYAQGVNASSGWFVDVVTGLNVNTNLSASAVNFPYSDDASLGVRTQTYQLNGEWVGGNNLETNYNEDPTFAIPFVFGEPLPIKMLFGVDSLLQSSWNAGDAFTGASFGNSLYYAAQGVSDSGGNPLSSSDFSILADSGHDYLTFVPEPSSGHCALLGVVLGALAFRRRG